jgi:hypothetical protein
MKLKFFICLFIAMCGTFITNAQNATETTIYTVPAFEPTISVDPVDFSTYKSGVDCYVSGEFMLHAYENKLDVYTNEGQLSSFVVKSVQYKQDSTGVTKTYITTKNVKFSVRINGDNIYLKTPFDNEFTDCFQYEFVGILTYKFDKSFVNGIYFPYTSFSKNEIATPWGIKKVPPLN